MSLLLMAAAATAITMPPGNIGVARMINADYPADAERAGDEGVVLQRVLIKPDGRAQRCEAVQTIGNELFAEASCRSFRRWRFERPRAEDGSPIHALIQPIIGFTLENSLRRESIRMPNDLTLTVRGAPNTDSFSVMTQIGPDGRVQHCTHSGDTDSRLVAAACQAASGATWDIVSDESGGTVPYVRYVRVGIQPDEGASPAASTS